MIQFRLLAASVTAAGLLAAMPAAAAIKIARYSGTVLFGYDQTGVFTAPGTSLGGYGWVATFTYDRTLGGVQNTDGFSNDESFGGDNYGTPGMSPIISASITINGVTRSFDSAWSGHIYTSTYPNVSHNAQNFSDDGIAQVYNYISVSNDPAGAPGSLDQNFGPVAAAGGNGTMYWSSYDYLTDTYPEFADAYLSGDIVYSVGDAVPEPTSWAMMIAGFGLVGTALRRRRVPVGAIA